MAKLLYANWFAWGNSSNLQNHPVAGTQRQLQLKITTDGIGVPVGSNHSIMLTDGKFVGMIVYVRTNPTSGPVRFTCVKTPFVDDAYDLADDVVLGTVTIPAGEVGCFYSDPDTSDASRSYFAFDNITIRRILDSGGGGQISDVDILIGMDFSSGSLIGPYHPHGLHSPGF